MTFFIIVLKGDFIRRRRITMSRPGSERELRAALQSFELGEEIERLRGEKAWLEGKRNAITLRKGGGMSVVLLVMRAGDRLEEHAAPGPISVSVHEGRIRFTTPEGEIEADKDKLISCEEGLRHSVEAIEDSVCVVTIASARTSPIAD
jgi:quercetin dioxygenase-like cupin family protein